MIRAFLAVELSEELRRHLETLRQTLKPRIDRQAVKGVRISWVQTGAIHLTVKFLGDLDEDLIGPLRNNLGDRLTAQRGLRIPIERLGAFPHLQQPRILWAGPSDPWEQGEDATRLASVHGAVEECCEGFGFARDGRRLSPHLTLARIKEGSRQLGQSLADSGLADRALSMGSLVVESIVLMKSELKPAGSVYSKLWEVPVGGR